MPAGGVNQFLLCSAQRGGVSSTAVFGGCGDGRTVLTAPLKSGWLYWVRDLHSNLLAGPNGRTVNGVVALILMAMCASGLVIWLPKQHWRLSLRAGWKRQVWNLHNAAGIFALVLLLGQGFIGAYFAFPGVYRAALGLPARAKADAEKAEIRHGNREERGHKKADRAPLPLPNFLWMFS